MAREKTNTTTVQQQTTPAFGSRLVYFDPQGQQYGGGEDAKLAEEMLRLFAGKYKAVRRSSGGLVLAEPFELIVYGDPQAARAETLAMIPLRGWIVPLAVAAFIISVSAFGPS